MPPRCFCAVLEFPAVVGITHSVVHVRWLVTPLCQMSASWVYILLNPRRHVSKVDEACSKSPGLKLSSEFAQEAS